MIADRYVWPDRKKGTTSWYCNCIQCQITKVHRHNVTNLQRYPLPSQKFADINLDLAGPLPESNGYSYILVIVDRFSRWPVAIPLPDCKTHTILNAFMYNWLSLYGVPKKLTTDKSSQFLSSEWKDTMTFLGIQHIHTTAYHSQSNGLAERRIQTIKKSLNTFLKESNWYFYLPLTMLTLRSRVKEDLQCTSSEIVYKTQLRLPGEFFESFHTKKVQHRSLSMLNKGFF